MVYIYMYIRYTYMAFRAVVGQGSLAASKIIAI